MRRRPRQRKSAAPLSATVERAEPLWGDEAWLVRRAGREPHLVERSAWWGWWCDCESWKYRRECPHVKAVSGERPKAGGGNGTTDAV